MVVHYVNIRMTNVKEEKWETSDDLKWKGKENRLLFQAFDIASQITNLCPDNTVIINH